MLKTGFVKEKRGEWLSVCFERPEACAGCKGCAKGLLPKRELLTVFGTAQVGDRVDVELPEGRVLRATLVAYALPLCLLIAGLLIGTGLQTTEGITLLLAVLGVILGYLIAQGIEKTLRKRPAWRANVVRVYSQTNERKEIE